MALIDDIEELDNNDIEETSTIAKEKEFVPQEELGTNIYTNKERAYESLLSHISGMKWRVDYFNQIIGSNSKTSSHFTGLKTIQQYRRIKNAVVYLQSSLDSNVNVNELTLEFIVNFGITPNQGDMVVAKLIGGREAAFKVERVEKRHYQDHEVYYCSIKFNYFTNKNKETYTDLLEKISEHLIYDQNYVRTFGSPILLEKDYIDISALKRLKRSLIKFYFNNFVDKEYKVINPFNSYISGFKVVDPFLNNFLRKTIEVEESTKYTEANLLVNYNIPIYTYTILDAILERDSDYLDNITHTELGIGKIPVNKGASNVYDLGYLKLNGVVGFDNNLTNFTDKLLRVNTEETPLRDKLNDLKPYIFTSNFYKNIPELMLPIELLIQDYLIGEIIQPDKIYNLVKDYTKWSRYEQFYLIPIVIRILKTLTTAVYSDR